MISLQKIFLTVFSLLFFMRPFSSLSQNEAAEEAFWKGTWPLAPRRRPGSEQRAAAVITERLIADRTFQQPVVSCMEAKEAWHKLCWRLALSGQRCLFLFLKAAKNNKLRQLQSESLWRRTEQIIYLPKRRRAIEIILEGEFKKQPGWSGRTVWLHQFPTGWCRFLRLAGHLWAVGTEWTLWHGATLTGPAENLTLWGRFRTISSYCKRWISTSMNLQH